MTISRRNAYQTVRFAMLAATAAIFAFTAPQVVTHWDAARWIIFGVLLVLFVVLLELGVPFLAFRNFGQREGDPGRINFDLPLYALTFAVFGWFETAALSFLSQLLTRSSARRYSLVERLLIGGSRVPFFFLAGGLRAIFGASVLQYSLPGFGLFFAMNALWIAFFILVWFDSLTALRTGMPVIKLWRMHLSDGILWTLFAAQIVWGYVAAQVFIRDGAVLAIATLLPLLIVAATLRALHDQRLAVHRLTLARDAVQAMLGARDPLPHINAILSSVHTELLKETLQILAHTGSGADAWPTVASIGPPPEDAAVQVRRHAMRALIDGDRNVSVATSRDHVVVAFAARDSMDRLLGVLAVHRPAGHEHQMHRKQFEAAAAALAPLLRDFRTIAATQNAAAVDPLTGLANRRTILETARQAMETVAAGTMCSIVIMDLDNFKLINDQLGHQAGDRCLQLIGFVVANNIRACDRAGRIGGEEFVVLMPDAGVDVARVIGERLRGAIEQCGFCYADGTPVTASIGVATATITDTMETLMERADRALYSAKRHGRNRVVDLSA